MAISKIGRNSTDTGITDGSDATAITIDSSEKVGIGTASPQDPLHVYLASGQRIARFEANSSTSAHIGFKANNTSLMPTIGVKDEDLYLSTGDAVEAFRIDANGHVTMPLQSAFCATMSANQNNLAINTDTVVAFNTERFDQNADYNTSTFTFTAPVTGKYQLNFYIRFDQLDQDADHYRTRIVTSNRTYETRVVDPSTYDTDTRYHGNSGSVFADMDSGDTATAQFFTANSGNAQVDLSEGHFSGYLVC